MSDSSIKFKKLNKKPLRKRKESEDSENDSHEEDILYVLLYNMFYNLINTPDWSFCCLFTRSKLQETKELQKLRQRPHGISATALAVGKHKTEDELILVIIKILNVHNF